MNVKHGALENRVLNALWDLQREGSLPVFVGKLQERINSPGKQWAYTTVKTVIDRLVEKGLVKREKEGMRYHYRSVADQHKMAIEALDKVIRQYFKNDINAVLTCVNRLRESLEN